MKGIIFRGSRPEFRHSSSFEDRLTAALSGAFGSGAAFAFEDAYVLSQALSQSLNNGESIQKALEIYDEIRAPHYKALYEILDGTAANAKEVAGKELSEGEFVEEVVKKGLGSGTGWIYQYDVSFLPSY